MGEVIKPDFKKLSDGELHGLVDDLTENLYHAENELNNALGEAALRGIVPVGLPANVVSMDEFRNRQAQGVLFDMPDGAA